MNQATIPCDMHYSALLCVLAIALHTILAISYVCLQAAGPSSMLSSTSMRLVGPPSIINACDLCFSTHMTTTCAPPNPALRGQPTKHHATTSYWHQHTRDHADTSTSMVL